MSLIIVAKKDHGYVKSSKSMAAETMQLLQALFYINMAAATNLAL